MAAYVLEHLHLLSHELLITLILSFPIALELDSENGPHQSNPYTRKPIVLKSHYRMTTREIVRAEWRITSSPNVFFRFYHCSSSSLAKSCMIMILSHTSFKRTSHRLGLMVMPKTIIYWLSSCYS